MAQTWHDPFSPIILDTTVPQKFVDIINKTGDDVLSNHQKSIEWDWSHKLVGKVHKEVRIPISNKNDKNYLFNIMKQGCLDYLNRTIEENKAHQWFRLAGKDTKPTISNIHLTQSWIVSSYAGDFNPWHHHTGDFSAAIYLKIPEGMTEELEEEFKDHYPAKGLIEFCFGEAQNFRNDNLKFEPEVGKFLVFPAWLKHFVYPFTCEGERRMMSFNAHMQVE